MKALKTATLSAVALTAAAFCAVPAQAAGFGVYIGGNGAGVSVDTYREYCRDDNYRHRYSDYCSRYNYDNDGRYGEGDYRYRDQSDYRYRDECRDSRYHRRHAAFCSRFDGYDGRVGVSDDRFREYCRDHAYRQRYSAYCSQYYGNDDRDDRPYQDDNRDYRDHY